MKKIESVIDNCIDEIAPAICSNSVEEPVLLNDDLATKSNINIDKEEHLTLMDEDGSSLNLNLENMLLETFEIFDLDGDGYLNKEELDGFATFTNGEIFDENTLEELAWGFDVRSTDNALSKRGFIEMYTNIDRKY
ncbi:hypothetical protein HK099_002253 [Clydaea vesicula]|uniref:EF-hand domain-containing protein n=1 Tax=Clydaea vesicula TaxID=447962 RepID=A0AAD5XWW0_9FUNG|nr:hypothetical protein HK099_002253 [Clydaea vesicula]